MNSSSTAQVTDEMLAAGREAVSRDWQMGYIIDEDIERIYLAMSSLDNREATPTVTVERPDLASIRTWIAGLPHDMESRELVLADLDAAIQATDEGLRSALETARHCIEMGVPSEALATIDAALGMRG